MSSLGKIYLNKTWKGSNDIFTEKFRFWRVAEKLGGCGGYM